MGNYEIPIETNLKEYYVKEESYDGLFGAGKVIAPINGTTGNDRFYVMALNDINPGTTYCWYDGAWGGKIDNSTSVSFYENDFGEGRAHTEYAMENWNDPSLPWGSHNAGTNLDMWGVIEDEVDKGWFVPSKSEFAAFGGAFNIEPENYLDYGLSDWYWTSSLVDTNKNFTSYAYMAYCDR